MSERIFGFDRAQASFDAAKTAEGYLRGRALISKAGVFDYRSSEFGLPGGDRVIRVLRHPRDVFNRDSVKSFRQVPVTVEHQAMLDAANVAKFKVGQLGSDVQVDGLYLDADFVVDAKEGVDAIEVGGKREVSCGYWFELVEERGEYEGQAYDFRQVNIRGNHLALTEAARLGPELRISMDSKNFPLAVQGVGLDSTQSREQPMNLVKIALDGGLTYDAAPEVAAAIAKLRADLKTAEDKATTKETEATGLQAKLDAADAAKAKAEKELKDAQDAMPAKVQAAARELSDLLSVAGQVMDQDGLKALDGKSATEIKRAIIIANDSDAEARIKDKPEAYVDAYFDSIRSRLGQDSGAEGLAAAREAGAPLNKGQDAGGYQKAAKDFREKVLNRHKQEKK